MDEASVVAVLSNAQYGLRWLFNLMLRRSLVFINNLRLLPSDKVAPDELTNRISDLSSGEQLALVLWRLKDSLRDEESDRFARIRRLLHVGRRVAIDAQHPGNVDMPEYLAPHFLLDAATQDGHGCGIRV